MNYLQRLEFWGEGHHPKYLDILRIAFGIFLFFKGIEFANNTYLLSQMVGRVSFNSFLQSILVHYVLFAHIVGMACLIQIPILVGALVFGNWNMLQHFSTILITLLTLVLSIYFMIIGNGPWSLERVLFGNENPQKR